MSEVSPTVRSFALTATLTGAIVGFAGTTIYWARVTDNLGTFHLVRLDDLNRVEAPVAVLWLVLAAGGALAGRDPSPWATVIRSGTAVFATVGACFLLAFTVVGSDGGAVLAHAAVADSPSLVRVRSVLPDTGCLLYTVGLMLIGLGAAVTELAARGVRPGPSRPDGRPLLHRVLLIPALVVAVAAAVLPWYDQPTDGSAGPPGTTDVQAWVYAFRAGLAICLVVTILALIRRRRAPAYRMLGLIAGAAVTATLLSGYVVLWRQPLLGYATDRIGPGYHLGLLAMLLLTASFVALPPEVPREQEVA